MEKVKKMVEAGTSITGAIKEALAQNGLKTVTEFASKYSLNRASVSNHLNATVRADDATLAALADELGGHPNEWAELLWLAAKPEKASA
jgi:hypothetical protein